MCRKGLLFLVSLVFCVSCFSLELVGKWVQGGMLVGQVETNETVQFDGKQPRISPEGQFVIGLGRNTPSEVTLTVVSPKGSKDYLFTVEQRSYVEQRVEGVPQKTVTPPKHVSERIAQEAALVWNARSSNDPRKDFLAGFIKPLEGPITGVYGSRRVYNGIPKNPHYGLDIAAPNGSPVLAPAPGVVRLVHDDMYFSGGTLIIDHGYGIFSTYIHLSEILVKEGDLVDPSKVVAKVGSTGRATGPHLDWRINWFDVRLDPALVMQFFPAK